MIAVSGINGNGNGHGSHAGGIAAPIDFALPKSEDISQLNVHQRIRWISAEARSLPKSQWNPEGAFAYAGHEQIVEMLRLLLAKYGVNIYQEALEYKREASLGGIEHMTTVKYEYEVVNADAPDDRFVRHNWGEAMDDWDKGLNKCSTIAEKMFLLRLFKIATFDDPDAHSSDRARDRGASQNGSGKGRSEHRPAVYQNECEKCREPITGARRGTKNWQLGEVIAASKKQFGKRLCVDCLLVAQAQADGRAGLKAAASGSEHLKVEHGTRDAAGDKQTPSAKPVEPATTPTSNERVDAKKGV